MAQEMAPGKCAMNCAPAQFDGISPFSALFFPAVATKFLDKASSMRVPTAVFSALQPVECLAKSGDVFEAFVLVKRVDV